MDGVVLGGVDVDGGGEEDGGCEVGEVGMDLLKVHMKSLRREDIATYDVGDELPVVTGFEEEIGDEFGEVDGIGDEFGEVEIGDEFGEVDGIDAEGVLDGVDGAVDVAG